MTFEEHLALQPALVQNWVQWMGLINALALAFFAAGVLRGAYERLRKDMPFTLYYWDSMVMLVAALISGIFMDWLFDQYGYTRILGLAHVVFWTPAVAFLIWRLKSGAVALRSVFGLYLVVLVATNSASLIIDAIDVIRYLAGDTAIVGPAGPAG